MVQLVLQSYRNSNLFSNHFLQNRVVNIEEWKEEIEVKRVFKKIKEIYEDQKELLEKYNEPQLEENFIRPIFRILRHFFEVQETTDRSARRPDYGFFPNEEERRRAIKNKGKEDFYKTAIAIGDAKEWDRSLDKKIKEKDTFEFQNPSFQIDTYLRETKPKWGIITNGRKWRIYYQETSYRLDSYYEVDLIDIIEKGNLNDFKYFYFFFRREAFIVDSTGKCFLDKIFNQSIKYSQKLGENLEENIYNALLWMAKGYLNMKTNNLEKNEENLEIVHKNSLIFLYRLLFLFFAESKGLLGKEIPRKYEKEFSFSKWVEDILEDIDRGQISPIGGIYNHKLFRIFHLVNIGSIAMNIPQEDFFVPSYNGGLFNDNEHPFLNEKKIQDGYIAKVVNLLARTGSEDGKRARTDYSDLSIRHLGGIYEGLLEYKLKIAEEDLVAIKKKGKLIWISKSKVGNKKTYDEARKGKIYLVTNKDERKVTGSYYTPDYIVKYIVKNTLEPIIEQKIRGFKNNEKIKETILSIKVLDPAMGSGHFLVEATDFLAQKLSLYLEGENGIETDIEWAKREIVKRCIYGVDLNPLAVELAKVSLWLNTISKDKPLSFLDHHLRIGNSLIGADIENIVIHPNDKHISKNNLTRFFVSAFNKKINDLLNLYKSIMERKGVNVDDIRKQEETYHELRNSPFRVRFDELANLYTSYYFGNKFSEKEYENVLSEFKLGTDNWNKIQELDIFKKAQKIAKEEKFFHWKLEFLEVFFDLETGEKKNPGFDIVLGNPPYGSKKMLSERQKKYVKQNIEHTGSNDLAEMFISNSFIILRKNGGFGFIVPKPLTYITSWSNIRRVLSNKEITSIIDVGKAFEEVLLEQVIITARNMSTVSSSVRGGIVHKNKIIDDKIIPRKKLQERIFELYAYKEYENLIQKIKNNSFFLGRDIDIFSGAGGITPYLNKKEGEDCIRGDDIDRYQYVKDDFDLLSTKRISNEEYKRNKQPKVISQDIVAHITTPKPHIKLTSHIDYEGKLTHETIINFIPKKNKKISLEMTVALINSHFMSWYVYNFIFNRAIRTMHYRPGYADYSPFPKKFKKAENTIKESVKKMIKLCRIKYKEQKSFLKWVSREWDVNIEDLSQKTHLKEYWKYDLKEIIKIAKRNKSKIKGTPSSRKFQETLEKEWKKSVKKLRSLLEEFHETYNLIDAIICKLYNLNEDEVKVVLNSFGTDENTKNNILRKFRKIKIN